MTEANDPTRTPQFEAQENKDAVFVPPSAAGSSAKVERDGTVMPGKAHEARTGRVTNPGVRSLGKAATAPRCPACGEATLKIRMNRRAGQRVYCSNPKCSYDQAQQGNTEQVQVNPGTKIVTERGRESGGVRILRQSGPR